MENVLIPDLIKDMVKKYKESKSPNEMLSLENRLLAIRDLINTALAKNKKFALK